MGKKALSAIVLAAVLLFLTYAGPVTAEPGYSYIRQISESNVETVPLLPNATVEDELSDHECRSYRVSLESGNFCRFAIEHSGIDVRIVVRDPSDKEWVDFESRGDGRTAFPFVAEQPGSYRLDIHAIERFSACGRYSVTIEELRPRTDRDIDRVAAHEAFVEGLRLQAEATMKSRREAMSRFEDALLHWQAADEVLEQATVLESVAGIHVLLGESQKALDRYQSALQILREAGARRREVEVSGKLGFVFRQLGEHEKATALCTQALEMSRSARVPRGEARALFTLGLVDYSRGNLTSALERFGEAERIWRNLGDRREQANTHLYIGHAQNNLNHAMLAMDSFREAHALWLIVDDRRGVALALRAQGSLYSKLGEAQKALDFYDQARRIFGPMGDKVAEAVLLNGMAQLYFHLDEVSTALGYYEKALSLFRSVGLRRGEGTNLFEIGRCKFWLGESRRALDHYQQAIAVFRELGDKRMEAGVLGSIGQILDASGKQKEALDYYRRALELNRAAKHRLKEAETLNDIGLIYLGWGQAERALANFKPALDLCRATKDRYGESLTLYNTSVAERSLGNMETARRLVLEALSIDESLRADVASPDLRASFFASIHEHLEFYIDLLMDLHGRRPSDGYDEKAFRASERARARSLLDNLSEARVDIRQGIDPELLQREESLQRMLNDKVQQQLRLADKAGSEEALSIMEAEIRDLATQLDQVQALIRSKSPRYASLTRAEPLSLDEIQRHVLDASTLLLAYSLGEKRSFLWAISSDGYVSRELPPRGRVEDAARRVYESLTARLPRSGESLRAYRQRVRDADSRYWQEAAWLSETLLGPVADRLVGKRLVIVGDGALQYLPFAALPVPGKRSADDETIPLVLEHEVVNLPSASTLAVLREEASSHQSPGRAVAVLADPVFELDDPRLTHVAKPPDTEMVPPDEETPLPVSRRHRALRGAGFSDQGRLRLPRLPATRHEAEAIISSAAPGEGLIAMGFDACRETAMSPELGRYRIVHFATHGIINNDHPELSGVVLSTVDEQGRPRDGFMGLHDIYNLELPVDMVVLSACNSALGKQVRGEGLVGIVRGFMYAGAPRVVASLWKVDDEATGQLMGRFYRRMLKDDLPPAAALREAQIEMWRQTESRFPFFWAAFVLQGDWR